MRVAYGKIPRATTIIHDGSKSAQPNREREREHFPRLIKPVLLLFFLFGITPTQASAATAIYRSVGPGATAPITTGTTNALTIADSTATFAYALPDNIGVGDAIQYDSDGNDSIDSIAFIHGRTSSTVYTIKTASGAVPTAVTGDNNWEIYRAYTSLYGAERGDENDGLDDAVENFDDWTTGGGKDDDELGKALTTADQQWNIACYADAADTTAVTISGWTTDATRYLRIYTPVTTSEVGTSQRHSGVWDNTKYTHRADAWYSIQPTNSYIKIDGLQFDRTGSGQDQIGSIYSTDTLLGINISNNLFRTSNSSAFADSGIHWTSGWSTDIKIWNNIFYNFTNGITDSYGIHITGGYIYNNTFYNCYKGIGQTSSTVIVKNNIVQGSNGVAYEGTFDASSNYNISNDATAPNATFSGNNLTVSFTDAINNNFHLASDDTAAKNVGTNLSADSNLAFSNDIDGNNRPSQSIWDIGADEYIAPPTNDITISSLSVSNTTTTSFDAQISFDGDENSNATVTLYYCNSTDSPGCNPTAGTSAVMTSGSGIYTVSVTGLSSPNDLGDEISLRVIATDADGVTGSPLNSTFQLGYVTLSSSYTTSAATSETFCTAEDYPDQWTWDPSRTTDTAQSATSGTPLVKQYRGGQLLATYDSLGGKSCTEVDNSYLNPNTDCGPFRRGGYRNWADGDIFEVYPAVYSGVENQPWFGPSAANYADYLAGIFETPSNITIRGITVNGIRPVIKLDTDGASNNTLGQSAVYFDQSENITVENIDIDGALASLGQVGKSGIYINGGQNITLRDMRIHGFGPSRTNGIFGTSNNSGTTTFDRIELYNNGGDSGPEHNIYMNHSSTDTAYTIHMVNSWSYGVYYGHTFKSRAQVNILEGNYFQGGVPQGGETQAEAFLVDIPNGGLLTMRNNILVKNRSAANSNGASVTFADEGLTDARPLGITIENNTFVGFTKYYDQSYPIWPFFFFYPMQTPEDLDFPVVNPSIKRNVFVGYCNSINTDMNYRGDLALTAGFADINQDFSLNTNYVSSDTSIVGTSAYGHIAQDGVTRERPTFGAKDFSSSDSTAPTVTAFTLPTISSSLIVPISAFTATDNTAVTGYLVNESASTPTAGDAGWSGTAQATYTFISDGLKTLYAWAKDAANNISTSLSDTVTVDTTAPTISSVSTITTPTSDNTPSFTFTSTEAGTLLYAGSCTPSSTSISSGSNTTTYTTLTDATYTTCAFSVIDTAGNNSATTTLTSFTVDTTAPILTGNTSTVFYQSQTITLAADSATTIRYTTDGSTPSCSVGTLYTTPLTITAHTEINAIACDAAGNASIVSNALYNPLPTSGGASSATQTSTPAPAPTPAPTQTQTPAPTSTPAPSATPSGLSQAQVSSILTVLASFNVDPATLLTVTAILNGSTLTPSSTSGQAASFTPSSTSGQAASFTRDLTLNMTGPDVTRLQQFLNAQGFTVSPTGAGSPGQETQKFGLLTQAALIKYQKANGITPAVGYFGKVTRGRVGE